ncbi:hypothetical protein F4677DRAFT_338520 [Hypoxylon crocopeplum]|nr:hypothetical protein F4677DRAFT_338520 [Hypoxylon crocopeplum]
MAGLLSLPNEILIAILEALATVDLKALITSQLTNRRFNALVQDAIYNIQNISTAYYEDDDDEIRIHPLWRTTFKGLFNTADCFTVMEKRRMAFLSLNGDYTLPFYRLPWAQKESKRNAYLRPGASWRNISLTFGGPPIKHLDVVKSYSAPEGDSVEYYQLDLASSGMTMGLFYDVLLCENATYGSETGSWELILRRRLRSYDVLSEYECFIPDDRDLVDFGEEARQAAVLYVRGGPVNPYSPYGLEDDSWIAKNRTKQHLLPWQGPIQNFIFSGYYD